MNDEDLKRLLRSSDPARTLPPLASARIDALTEHAMTISPDLDDAPSVVRHLSRRRLVAFGTSLVGAAAGIAVAVPLLMGPAAPPTALKTPSDSGGPATLCAPVSAESIGLAEIAFRGRVIAVQDGVATLQVLHRYTGAVGDTATVPQGDGSQVDGAAPVFTLGSDYLVAANDRTVIGCGSTGVDSPALRAIYDRAFAR